MPMTHLICYMHQFSLGNIATGERIVQWRQPNVFSLSKPQCPLYIKLKATSLTLYDLHACIRSIYMHAVTQHIPCSDLKCNCVYILFPGCTKTNYYILYCANTNAEVKSGHVLCWIITCIAETVWKHQKYMHIKDKVLHFLIIICDLLIAT